MKTSSYLVPTLLCGLAASPLFAQQTIVLDSFEGSAGSELSNVADAGDVNADGYGDYIVGAPFDASLHADGGKAWVVSGADGSTIWTRNATDVDQRVGSSVAGLGDVDGDGYADFVQGDSRKDAGGFVDSGRVSCISGRTNTLIWTRAGSKDDAWLGADAQAVDDFNGDGIRDLIVGSPFATHSVTAKDSGQAYVMSGADGTTLLTLEGNSYSGLDRFGGTVAGLGDVNGDGTNDFIVSANRYMTHRGAVTVFSGFDGSQIYRWEGTFAGQNLGHSLAGLDDLNGDGRPEFAIGSRTYDVDEMGRVAVYSGIDGSLMHERLGTQVDEWLGTAVCSVSDLDGDGIDDIMMGASNRPAGTPGYVVIHSGATFTEIARLDGSGADGLGQEVAEVGDLDGDGAPSLAAGGNMHNAQAGRIDVFELHSPRNFLRIGPGCLASISAGASLDIDVDVDSAHAGGIYQVFLSLTPGTTSYFGATLPVGLDSYLTDSMRGVYPAQLANMYGFLDGNGDAQASFQIGAGQLPPSLAGLKAYMALAVSNPFFSVKEVSTREHIEFVP